MDLPNSFIISVNLWSIVLNILTGSQALFMSSEKRSSCSEQIASGTYGYSKRCQHLWSQKYKNCAGKRQSPIAISSSKCVALPLPAIEMNGYHDYLSGPIQLQNNGHTVLLKVNKYLSTKRLPYIFGAMLNDEEEYEFEGLHFHWGLTNSRGSEHTLNGVRFPMEMHVIHKNVKYSNMHEALEYDDSLAILAIFFQLQEENNEKLKSIIKILPNIRWMDLQESMNISFILASLIPKDIDTYYTYKGSLTSPPCSEVVTWIVFPTPVPISFRQMEYFRKLSNGEAALADNFRHVQDIRNRKVYVRRLTLSFARNPDMINLNVTQLNWYWQ